jgi:Asp/Glu/hydantoin racemase
MTIAKGGKKYYGEAIGIAIFDGLRYAMIPGDVGNASTYDFPVRIKTIKGLSDNPYPPITDEQGNYTEAVHKTVNGVKELAAEGVRAVVTCCGFFSLVQDLLAKEVDVPVFTSPLMLVPLISRMIGPDREIGIITASEKLLTRPFLEAVGIEKEHRVVIAGLESSREFYATHMGGPKVDVDVDRLRLEVVEIARRQVNSNHRMGALLLECTTLPSFSADIHAATGLPVFDYVSFINMLYQSVAPKKYHGIL